MKKWIGLLVLLMAPDGMFAQSNITPYHQQAEFALASPGALGVGLYGYDNPAMLNWLRQSDLLFAWSNQHSKWNGIDRWGLFAAVPHLGFGVIHTPSPLTSESVSDYKLSLGFGDRSFSLGVGYGWSSGDERVFNRSNLWTMGVMIRPSRWVSLGLIGSAATADKTKEGVLDLGIRPLGNEWLTVFGDFAIQNKKPYRDGNWSAGAALEILPGVRLTGRWFDDQRVTVGFNFSFGHTGVASQAHMGDDFNAYATSAIRIGAYDRNIFRSKVTDRRDYVEMNLKSAVRYQRYKLFDRSQTLINLIGQIDAAKNDPAVGGLAINLSGAKMDREIAWEVREKLKDFKSAGKRVVIYIDYTDINKYHLASVADKIILDPLGLIMIEGYIAGRTFYKGTLDKLGIGYDEWRFFKYKSANESFSRESMSEADREQREAMIKDLYELVRADVCESRKIGEATFDAWVNETALFQAEEALKQGLVDALGRWETVEEEIKKLEGTRPTFIAPKNLAEYREPFDDRWGEKPQIAVIYAIGVCAMDYGIRARTLSKEVQKAFDDRRIAAIVLRIDSPGGDALASDLVADVVRKNKGRKPLIVSQGMVAASGGYWLSMYADTIVAAPQTLTGSIGVIGGWIYNKGLKEKTGLSTDFVKIGKYADFGFGANFPLLGAWLPDRNLNEDERGKLESLIKIRYTDFVNKVAVGRRSTYDQIEAVAQGRVWSGVDGKANGLVDVLGGLETAIQIAKIRAGFKTDEKITIVEKPKPGWLDPRLVSSQFFGVEWPSADPVADHLLFRLKHNGQVMPVLPLEEMEIHER